MKKVAIVGVEGSGKTVMLAGLGELYSQPDDEGYFLAPKNYGTAAYVSEKIGRMRKGEWPVATAGDEMLGLDWTLKQKGADRQKPVSVCEVSCLDFAGEVYRAAYGISGARDAEVAENVGRLKDYIRKADELIVLINLRDVIANGLRDTRVSEAMWITKSILDTALHDERGGAAPRAAIVLSQSDSYAATIAEEGGALGVLRKYLPHVANDYDWLDIFEVSSVDKTILDDDGNMVPAPDFKLNDLCRILDWIIGDNRIGQPSAAAGAGASRSPQEAYSKAEAKKKPQSGTSEDSAKVQPVNGGAFAAVLLSAVGSALLCVWVGHWGAAIPICLCSWIVLGDRGAADVKQTTGAWLLCAVFLLVAGGLSACGHWVWASISAFVGGCVVQK